MDALHAALIQRLSQTTAEVAVAYQPLAATEALRLNTHTPFHAASTMKVAVMLALFQQAHAGHLRLDDYLPIHNQFHSIVDGSAYALTLETPEEIQLAAQPSATLLDLCRAMIVVSSNLATNLLMAHLGADSINPLLRQYGIHTLHVLRGLEDGKAFAQGLNNTTDADALLRLMLGIARHEVVSPAACDQMISILKGQQFRDAVPAGLPPGVDVAHKTGEIARHHHDAGIVYGPRPYVLVVLTRGLEQHTDSAALIADISRIVYAHA